MIESIGQTKTEFFHFTDTASPLILGCGETLADFTLAYEMYGELSKDRDNVILLFHALSASQHAAGHTEDDFSRATPRCMVARQPKAGLRSTSAIKLAVPLAHAEPSPTPKTPATASCGAQTATRPT